MKTDRTLALAAEVFILLAPAAHAGQENVSKRSCAAVMVGTYSPESPDLDGRVALLLADGSMVYRQVVLQVDFGGFSTADNCDGDVRIEWIAAFIRLAIPVVFVEPYVLGGVNFSFGVIQIGAEARQVWLQGDGHDDDGLMIMSILGYRL